MSKIVKIKIKNFKAIDSLEMDFKGCTAIVTGGNNKGKTSALRGMIDRIRFTRPQVKVHAGQTEGSFEMTLDSGENFKWEFNDADKDKLVYEDTDGKKYAMTKEIAKRFFPEMFDIDKFLNSSPKEQVAQLQKIVGIDFTAIDKRYEDAYKERSARNDDSERFHVKLSKMLEVPKVDPVDLTNLQAQKSTERRRLDDLYLTNKDHNDKLRKAWSDKKDEIKKEVDLLNKNTEANIATHEAILKCNAYYLKNGFDKMELLEAFATKWKNTIQPIKAAEDLFPVEPEYIPEKPSEKTIEELDAKILTASEINTKAKAYKDYIDLKAEVEAAKLSAKEADVVVKEIEEERRQMIAKANFPEGITIESGVIMIDGLPLDNNQVSSSRKYTAALQIGAIVLGEVKTLYFDASYCDKNTLGQIDAWANSKGYQLLIERPDWEGGPIKVEIQEEGIKDAA